MCSYMLCITVCLHALIQPCLLCLQLRRLECEGADHHTAITIAKLPIFQSLIGAYPCQQCQTGSIASLDAAIIHSNHGSCLQHVRSHTCQPSLLTLRRHGEGHYILRLTPCKVGDICVAHVHAAVLIMKERIHQPNMVLFVPYACSMTSI